MLKRSLNLRSTHWMEVLAFALLASTTASLAVDPAPASPPVSGDPAPASPPSSGGDPAPALPPVSVASDPAPASPPRSGPVLLIDMPKVDSGSISTDPAPAEAPGSAEVSLPTVEPVSSAYLAATPDVKSGKAFLGVGFRDPSNTIVTTLWSNSTAAKLGIQLGDRIVSINGFPVGNLQQIRDVLGSMSAGDDATVTISRGKGAPVSVGPMPLGASAE